MASSNLEDGVEQVEVIVGTYEEFLLGYKLVKDGENEKYSLVVSFTNHSQSKSIRAVQAIGKFVAAGSADESISLINMDARVEHGSLQEQNGTITCLCEYDGSYLFSGCEDGTICIWKKGSWMCEKTLRAHTGGVVDVSVHPSGKLALSIGKDKALKTWNLVKGRCGYVTNLKAVADVVRWSPEGSYYAVGLSNRVDVYNLHNAKVVYSIPVGKRISCICFIDESTIAIAGDKDSAEMHDLKCTKKLSEFVCHKVRVKALKYVPVLNMLITASNDGFVKIWKFTKGYEKPPTLIAEVDTTCRITCMDVWVKATSSDGDEENTETILSEHSEDDSEDEDNQLNDDEDSSSMEYEEVEEPPSTKKRRKVK